MTKRSQAKLQLWLANHWLLLFNFLFAFYITLPLLAPVLLANGYTRSAGWIYWVYGFTCHQLPAHSFFIFDHQVAICQRCTAIHGMMVVVGLLYAIRLFRLPPLPFRWFLLFIIPMGLDGGMQMVSQLLLVIPAWPLWGLGLGLIVFLSLLLYQQQALTWQVLLFFLAGPLALLYVQFTGPYESDWLRRTVTGFIYGVGVIWLIYPMLAESFYDLRRQAEAQLLRPGS